MIAFYTAFSLTAQTQTPVVENPVCNGDFAQLIVQQQVSESISIVEPPRRVKILVRSAEFLWKLDQPTARQYFTEAYKTADDNFKEIGFQVKSAGVAKANPIQRSSDLRMAVIESIAKKDSEWAKRLTDQLLADYEKSKSERNEMDKTREIEGLLSLAKTSAKTNPELSRYILRQLMRYPLFNHWFFALYGIHGDDPALADSIYLELLNNYGNETPRRLLFLSAYPFGNERIFGVDKYTVGTTLPPNISANQSLQRQFILTFFNRIASYAASTEDINRPAETRYQPEPVYMVSALREIEPYVIERFPDLLQRLSVAKSQASSLISTEMRKQLDDKEKQTNNLGKTFDELLADIEEADDKGLLTDQLIVSLVTWVEKTEEQFAKILPWLDKIKDENVRNETTNYFWFLRSKRAIKEKRIDDAEKFALKVPKIEHRSLLIFDIAEGQSKNAVDVSSLFETLNRLSKLVKASDDSVSKAQILLGLSNMYEKVNHSVALDELADAIRVTNNLDDPDIFSTTTTQQISGKGFAFFAVFSTPGYDLEKTFNDLSIKDFELSLANAKSLEDKYLRTIAVLAVAKNCAKNSKKTSPSKKRQS